MTPSQLRVFVPGRLNSIPTGGPWSISDPVEKLRAKYLQGDESYPSVDFDLYAAQRALDPGWRNRIEGGDLYATLLMNSNVRLPTVSALIVNQRTAVERALADVPRDLALEHPHSTSAVVESALHSLFSAMFIPRIRLAKATKLLSLKRPALIPMLDTYVMNALYLRWHSKFATASDFGDSAIEAIRRFRSLMLAADPARTGSSGFDNAQHLREIARAINSLLATSLPAERIGSTPIVLTQARVLETLLWFDWGGYARFDYHWDQKSDALSPPSTPPRSADPVAMASNPITGMA